METNSRITRSNWSSRLGFTLVELLVVITIIGILASLITAAAVAALRRAQQQRIKTELDQIHVAVQTYRDTNGSYPPNCQVDGTGGGTALDDAQVLTDLRRHFKQAFPRNREPDALVAALAGLTTTGTVVPSGPGFLQGGMSAGEAIVFWLGGFSSDPKYPISGEGGPSYRIDNLTGGVTAPQADPIESRKWVFPFEISRLRPRTTDNYFDDSVQAGERYIEYTITIPGQNNNDPQRRRINFWQYVPAKSEQPYLYFDVSRHPAAVVSGGTAEGLYDPPAATELTRLGPTGEGLHVHPVKSRSESAAAASRIQFANQDKFQILHCGIDDEWGVEAFDDRMSVHVIGDDDPSKYLLFPDGPFTGDAADTIVNFAEGTLEASQP